jgi:hypothetical protein
MTLVLTVLNIALIMVVVILLLSRRAGGKNVLSNLEDIELIEFQQNLKELVDELHRLAETKIRDMDLKKKETEDVLAEADAKIKEMKYLIERNQLIRRSEYKTAIAQGTENDALFPEPRKRQQEEISKKTRPQPARFVMNEAPERGPDGIQALQDSGAGRDRYAHINNLINNGLSIEEVSKVTGMSRGEIELIKNIKK